MYQRKEMKYILLCFSVFSIGVNADLVTLKIEEAQDSCKNVTGIDQTLIDQAQNGQFSDDEKLREYYHCYGTKIGYIKLELGGSYGKTETQISVMDWQLLEDWLVDKLQYDSKTASHVLTSCKDKDLFQPIKCLSENKLPVDVVSANYVDHSVEDLNEYQDYCKKEFNVDQNSITEAQKGNFDDSDIFGLYYACYSIQVGFLESSGRLDFYKLEHWLKHFLKYDSDQVDLALQKCYKPNVGEDDVFFEEVLKIAKCFADEHVPVDVMANH